MLAGSALSFTACKTDNGGTKPLDPWVKENAPDYSAASGVMTKYTYAAPGNGVYTIDGISYHVTDEEGNELTFQTEEKYREYKDCGFDVIMLDADYAYNGEDFATSRVKELLDLCEKVGLKAIMFDNRIYQLSRTETSIVGSGRRFTTQKHLERYVEECMSEYAEHPAFYGLLLRDEPNYKMLPQIGAVYKAIKAVRPKCFAQCCLLPLSDGSTYTLYKEGATSSTVLSAYKWYVEEFLKQTEADYVMTDSYPMESPSGQNVIKPLHLKGMQIITEIANEYGADFQMCIQSFSMKTKNVRKHRSCTEEDMYWQWYVSLGMGAKEISYFTYQRKKNSTSAGEYFDDGTSFISSSGEKTPLYTWVQDLHSELQGLISVVLNFEYKGMATYVGKPAPCNIGFLNGINDDEFAKIEEVTVSDGSVLMITEMYDEVKNQYGYMIINVADPSVKASVTAKVNFGNSRAVSVYDRSVNTLYQLDGNAYEVTLSAGQGVFVLPY